MNKASPQLPKEFILIDDFSTYALEFLQSELPISTIKSSETVVQGEDFYNIEIKESVFDNSTFHSCKFHKASFTDVIFQSCDFSNTEFTDAYFERCIFASCKCMGLEMSETLIKKTIFRDTNLQYSCFDRSKLTDVLFEEVDFTESSMAEAKLKNFQARKSKFLNNNFFKTLLATIDFTENDFVAPIVSSPPIELKGVKVNLLQAADLIRLWGIIVKV